MKLRILWETRESLVKLLHSDLDIALAWRLKPLAQELRDLETTYVELLRKHGNSDGGAIIIPPETRQQFVDEFEALMNEELKIELKPVRLSELDDGIRLSADDLDRLDYLIVEG